MNENLMPHIHMLEYIIKLHGECTGIECGDCPLIECNSIFMCCDTRLLLATNMLNKLKLHMLQDLL